MKYILIIGITILLIVIFSIDGKGQTKNDPRQIQARIFEITKQDNKRFEGKAISMTGDTLTIRYGFSNWHRLNLQKAKVGTWLTIHSYYSDKYEEWYCRRITIND